MNIGELGRNEIDKLGEQISVIYEGREFANIEMRQRQ